MLELMLVFKRKNMIKKLTNFTLVVILASLLAVPAFAQENGDSAEGSQGRREPSTTQTTLEQRQAERRARFATALTEREATRLSSRCKSAQVVIKGASDRAVKVIEARSNKYDQLTAKLVALSARLSEADIDTAKFDETVQQTQTLIDAFTALADKQELAIADSAEVDCRAEPSAFKIALEDARSQRAEIKQAADAIKDYVKSDVKTELQNIRALLAANASSQDQPDGVDQTRSSTPRDPDTPVSSEETN